MHSRFAYYGAMRFLRRFLLWLLALVLLLALAVTLAYHFLPWKNWLTNELRARIEAQGIRPASFAIDHLTLDGAVLKNVALGEPPLNLASVEVTYDWRKLLERRRMDALTIHALNLRYAQTQEGAWVLDGLGPYLAAQPKTDAPPKIPTDSAWFDALPLPRAQVKQSSLRLEAADWQMDIPFTLTLTTTPAPKLELRAEGISGQFGEAALSLATLSATATLDTQSKTWQGDWKIKGIALDHESLGLPVLAGEGTLSATAEVLTLKGAFADSAKTTKAQFEMNYSLPDPASSRLSVARAQMPWGGGSVGITNLRWPLMGSGNRTLSVRLSKVDLGPLMQALTGNQATATGVVSGTVPITLLGGGGVRIGAANLKADAPGIIALSPEAIPGDNTQVALVREVLKNLHYSLLSLELSTDEDNRLRAVLAVDGNNPEIEGGRPIKLKVNLSGDLLNLVLQNLKLMGDPKTFIEQHSNETLTPEP
jgi:hypothetical protein